MWLRRRSKALAAAAAFALLPARPSRAFWLGDPGDVLRRGGFSLRPVFEQGKRRMFETSGHGILAFGGGAVDAERPPADAEVSSHRFYLQGRGGLGGNTEFFVRAVPGAQRLNFKGSPYNPHMFGGGAGLKWAAPWRAGPVSFGGAASWDWAYGIQNNTHTYPSHKFLPGGLTTANRRDNVNWTEGALSAGASFKAREGSSLYAGYSFLRTKVFWDSGDEVDTYWHLRHENGAYAGLALRPAAALSILAEFHFGNERTLAFALDYNFNVPW